MRTSFTRRDPIRWTKARQIAKRFFYRGLLLSYKRWTALDYYQAIMMRQTTGKPLYWNTQLQGKSTNQKAAEMGFAECPIPRV